MKTSSRTRRASSLAFLVLIPACFGGQYTPTQYYTPSPSISVEQFEATDMTLSLRPLEYARMYKTKMVYRTSDHAIGYSEFHRWAELPRDTVSRALIDALTQTQRFAGVGFTHEGGPPDFLLSGEIRRFDQDRSSDPWTARCSVQLQLKRRATGRVLWSKTLTASQELDTNAPESFARAMSQALSGLIEEAAGHIASHANP